MLILTKPGSLELKFAECKIFPNFAANFSPAVAIPYYIIAEITVPEGLNCLG